MLLAVLSVNRSWDCAASVPTVQASAARHAALTMYCAFIENLIVCVSNAMGNGEEFADSHVRSVSRNGAATVGPASVAAALPSHAPQLMRPNTQRLIH